MKPLRVPLAGLRGGVLTLPESTARYVVRVHRRVVGDALELFDPRARIVAQATIAAVHDRAVTVEVDAPHAAPSSAARDVRWIHALPKGDKPDAIVADATELGATELVFASSERAVVKLDAARARARTERWRRIAEQAARQSGRGDVPAVEEPVSWADALYATQQVARFCLYERATVPLGPALSPALARGDSLAFSVGPEGGLSDDEVACAVEAGFAPVSLGPVVLRTETVCAAVLGAVLLGR